MFGKPTNHELAHKMIAMMFGDMYAPFLAAANRVGGGVVAHLLGELARDQEMTTETMAAIWVARFDRPVDYGLIEMILASRDRMHRNPLLLLRASRSGRKAGIIPPHSIAA